MNKVDQTRRFFFTRSVSMVGTLLTANASVYLVGMASKKLDGSLVAGAKYTFTACFVAGTKVTMADGSQKNIEEINVGELVATYDEIKGNKTVSPVEEIFHHPAEEAKIFKFTLGNSSVTSNDLHLFYLPKENKYLSAFEIYKKWKSGESVQLLSYRTGDYVGIDGIEVMTEIVPLYNLHVTSLYDSQPDETIEKSASKAGHNYFANDVLVHNVKFGGCGSSCRKECDAAYDCGVSCTDNGNLVTCEFSSAAERAAFDICYGSMDTECP